MHRSHARHEAGPFKISVLEHIECIFSLADHCLAGRLDQEILIPIEKPHFLERNPERLSGHRPQIVRREPLPARPTGKIEADFIHQAGRLQPDPLPPIQTYPSAEEGSRPLWNRSPTHTHATGFLLDRSPETGDRPSDKTRDARWPGGRHVHPPVRDPLRREDWLKSEGDRRSSMRHGVDRRASTRGLARSPSR